MIILIDVMEQHPWTFSSIRADADRNYKLLDIQIAGSSGSYWWETLEDPPRVFRTDKTVRSAPGEAVAIAGAGNVELQVAEWEFPGADCRKSRRILSVVDRPRVDRGTLHWGDYGGGRQKATAKKDGEVINDRN